MTIIVAGYIVAYPLAGMTWHHLNYLLGLKSLGHDVWFLEDSGDYLMPFNPARNINDVDSSYGRAYLERCLGRFGLSGRWCYYSQFENKFYGLSESALDRLCRRADLFLNVSTVNLLRPMYAQVRQKVAIDTDPVFTQIRLAKGDDYLRRLYSGHDFYFTFGENIGLPDCDVPTGGIAWHKTRQPVWLEFWRSAPSSAADAPFSTIMQWRSYDSVEFGGRVYGQKDVGFRSLFDLPRQTRLPLEVAVSKGAPESDLRAAGWRVTDSLVKTATLESYRDYIVGSRGELSVAKNGYVAGRCGWFSERSACYLACGRPVVAQDTGFSRWLPAGEGLIGFDDAEDARAGLERVAGDYARHAATARRIAEEFFDSRKVLEELLELAS